MPGNSNEAIVTNKILQVNLPLTSPDRGGVVTVPSIFLPARLTGVLLLGIGKRKARIVDAL